MTRRRRTRRLVTTRDATGYAGHQKIHYFQNQVSWFKDGFYNKELIVRWLTSKVAFHVDWFPMTPNEFIWLFMAIFLQNGGLFFSLLSEWLLLTTTLTGLGWLLANFWLTHNNNDGLNMISKDLINYQNVFFKLMFQLCMYMVYNHT